MLLKTVIKIDHEWFLFSDFSVSQISFELASPNFRGFTVCISECLKINPEQYFIEMKGAHALRGLFGPLWSQKLKISFDWFIRRITEV